MSAYIVNRKHVLYIVGAAMSRAILPGCHGPFSWVWNRNREAGTYEYERLACNDYEKAVEVANMLWQENIKSVSHRYPGETTATLPGPVGENHTITIEDICHNHWPVFDPVQVIKAIHCYEYQTCEHPEWEQSQAFAFCKHLERAAIDVLPGYEDAEWGAPEIEPPKVMREAFAA